MYNRKECKPEETVKKIKKQQKGVDRTGAPVYNNIRWLRQRLTDKRKMMTH